MPDPRKTEMPAELVYFDAYMGGVSEARAQVGIVLDELAERLRPVLAPDQPDSPGIGAAPDERAQVLLWAAAEVQALEAIHARCRSILDRCVLPIPDPF